MGSRYDRILGIFDESASTKETFTVGEREQRFFNFLIIFS